LGLTAIGGASYSYLNQDDIAPGQIMASTQEQTKSTIMLAEQAPSRALQGVTATGAQASLPAGAGGATAGAGSAAAGAGEEEEGVIDEEAVARAAARTALAAADVKLAESEHNAAKDKLDAAEKIAKLAVDAAVYAGQEADLKKREYDDARVDENFE